ncbi:hypothetical protein PIB30_077453 [Stylosanthes scabra]|uniref:Transmembrane protein n=1 Tax=Stylosanthes scabra TaxID=79078 RepID=A0ABU6RQT4_9FABA|nr:hypothetical protein [Stylosanthes scabra]
MVMDLRHGEFLHNWVEEHLVEGRFILYEVVGIFGFVGFVVGYMCMVGGIGSVVVVGISSIDFAGYHTTLEVVYNTVCCWVEIAGFHRSCEIPQWYGPPAIGGIYLYDVNCMNICRSA